ncbi:hypothetical protein [Pseudomonas gingeri]|uniref:hypothetical protein n=1 Tax=Pseudomonas gingeri TaxID=117681 RepID=UPI0015A26049|nr:hypothetical protein [Pseudomonas gingeri]NWA99606.1 hypothetical protein [Pseudomonas gingeri]
MKVFLPMALLGLFASLSGCAKDRGLAPPPDSEQITVTVKVPKEFEAETMSQGQSDLYEAKLPIDGGGKCQWRLSSVIFGVVYSNPTYFGENVTYGALEGLW